MKTSAVKGLFAAAALAVTTAVAGAEPFPDNSTVVFFGDSITRSGRYFEFVTDFYRTRYPNRHIRFIGAGHGGDTASGANARISYDVAAYNPTHIAVNFGMNDVNRGAFPDNLGAQESARNAYQSNLDSLVSNLKSAVSGATILYMTPTIYDDTAEVLNPPPETGWWSVNQTGCNEGLRLLGDIVKAKAEKEGAFCVDWHQPMNDFLKAHQQTNPNFMITVHDRVHPTELGHAIMAFAFLKEQGVDPVVSDVEINAAELTVAKSEKATISALCRKGNAVAFSLLASSLPFPVAPEAHPYLAELEVENSLNRETLKVTGLTSGDWALKIDGARVGTYSAAEFAEGVRLGFNSRTPQYRQARRVFAADLELYHREEAFRNLHDIYEELKGSINAYPSIAAWNDAGAPGSSSYWQYVPALVRYWSRREEEMADLYARQQEVYAIARPEIRKYELVPATEAGEDVDRPVPEEVNDRDGPGGGVAYDDGCVACHKEKVSVANIGKYRVYKFLEADGETQLILRQPARSVRYLVVGGGGAGAWTIGGGGGGGGVLEGEMGLLPIGTTITLKAGAGGLSPSDSGRQPGNDGEPSRLKIGEAEEIVALGGGGGGERSKLTPSSKVASGGGSGGSCRDAADGLGAAGTPGQGHDGGNAKVKNDNPAGGGGGAGEKGGDGANGKSGDGGEGLSSDITGTRAVYGSGGGGGGSINHSVTAGVGGENAGDGSQDAAGGSAPDGYGGGGGGGGYCNGEKQGGNGGGGTVVIALEFDMSGVVLYGDGFVTYSSDSLQCLTSGQRQIYKLLPQYGVPAAFTLKKAVRNFRYLVVGGGGAGAWTIGGGGGGGGVQEGFRDSLAKGTVIRLGVGCGGDAKPLGEEHVDSSSRTDGCDGDCSWLEIAGEETIMALGGGGGGQRGRVGHGLPDHVVASGGGAGARTIGGVATEGQGHDGGASAGESPGGGGGAGGEGTDGVEYGAAGSGGDGRSSDITGENVVYGSGGGGGAGNSCTSPGAGGANAGTGGLPGQDGGDAPDGYGGGGGGGGYSMQNERRGGFGGDGVIILAFETDEIEPDEPMMISYKDDFVQASAKPAVKSVNGRQVYVFGAVEGVQQVQLLRRAKDCRYLVAGGGGAGGWTIGGGGGGGEVAEGTLGSIRSGKVFKLTVGKGGKGSRVSDNASYGWNSGLDGAPSQLTLGSQVVASCLGGGGGGGRMGLAHGQPYENVATGGGGANCNAGGNGLLGRGYCGGNAEHESPGGGGGVMGPGQAGVWGGAGGAGGTGYLSTITGEARVYGSGGGGGAGNSCASPGARGSVQAGAGGAAGEPGESAADGYGCGGGGGGYGNDTGYEGGYGGDGTIVLSFDFSYKPGMFIWVY